MKKAITILIMAAMLISVFAGCGGAANTAQPSGSSPAAAAAEPASPAEDSAAVTESATVDIWCWDPNFNIPAAQAGADVYKTINPNVTVNVTDVPATEIYTKLTAAAVSGQTDTLPDIMLMHDRNIYKYVKAYEGVFAPLDSYGINFSDFAEYKLAAGNVDGVPYSIPFDNGATITAMRADLLEESGYTIDDFTDITWSRFTEIGKDVYAKTGRPLIIDRSDTPQLLNVMLQSTGSWYFKEDGSLNIANNETIKELFTAYKTLVDNNVLSRYNDSDSYYNALYTDNTTGVVNACWVLSSVVKAENQAGNWRITNVPRLENVQGALNYSNAGGSSWVVFNNDDTAAAADYLKNTFAGSIEMYNNILPSTSAIATWLPAQSGSNYSAPHAFFGGQPIYEMIMGYAANVPRVNYGVYSDEAYQAVNTALAAVLDGVAIETALADAESQMTFQMQ